MTRTVYLFIGIVMLCVFFGSVALTFIHHDGTPGIIAFIGTAAGMIIGALSFKRAILMGIRDRKPQ